MQRSMRLRVKEIRKAAGLTQCELAELAGIDRTHLSKIENEREPANTRRLAAIAQVLKVEVAELFEPDPDGKSYTSALMAVVSDLDLAQRQAVLDHARALIALRNRVGEK